MQGQISFWIWLHKQRRALDLIRQALAEGQKISLDEAFAYALEEH
jgi:hypothetical protein